MTESLQSTGALLDRKEAAEFLHVCKTTLDRLPIPRTRLRRRVLYRQSVLEQWLAENTETREAQ
jgi:hypothetical protein